MKSNVSVLFSLGMSALSKNEFVAAKKQLQ